MNLNFIFPPRTHPSYLPLGLATLSAIATEAGVAHSLVDLNIELWNHIASGSPQGRAARDFFTKGAEHFFAREVYQPQLMVQMEIKQEIDLLGQWAHQYVETGKGHPMLLQTLARQAQLASSFSPASKTFADNSSPAFIAISVMYPEQLDWALALSSFLKSEAGFRGNLLLGGALMSSLLIEEILQACPAIDAICTGEGEEALRGLITSGSYKQVCGWSYLETHGGNLAQIPMRIATHLDELPLADYRPLDINAYWNPTPVFAILASRGCQWRRCRFCAHNKSFGHYRQRCASSVCNEIESLNTLYGAQYFYLSDQYMTAEALREISLELLQRKLEVRFHIMARTLESYTPELLHLAASAGCCWISWGMESGSQRLLDLMGKGTNVEQSLQVIQNARQAGISNLLMMIFGTPGSTVEDLELTFNFMDEVYPSIDAMTSSAFVLFDQTPYARFPDKYGLLPEGREILYRLGEHVIHGSRLPFRRVGEEQPGESPLATEEVARWKKRRQFMGPVPLREQLCSEHFLIDAGGYSTRLGQ